MKPLLWLLLPPVAAACLLALTLWTLFKEEGDKLNDSLPPP